MTVEPYWHVIARLGVAAATAIVAPILLDADAASWPQRFLQSPVMLWLGTMSYGLYLVHIPILQYLVDTPLHDGPTAQRLLIYGGAVTLILAIAVPPPASASSSNRPCDGPRAVARAAPSDPGLAPSLPVRSPA